MGASPGAAVALTRMNAEIDVRGVLPSIRVPTLVLHRSGDRCLNVEEGRYLASRIPGAEFVELPGDDHLPFAGDQDDILEEIERFLARSWVRRSAGAPARQRPDRSRLIAGGRAFPRDLRAGDRVVSRGPIGGDGFTAMFDGPARAVQCAAAIALASGLRFAPGCTSAKWTRRRPKGQVVSVSRQLAQSAAPGEVLVSRTIVDLVPGSGLSSKNAAVSAEGMDREIPSWLFARDFESGLGGASSRYPA